MMSMSDNRCTKSLNPAAKPFLPLHENQHRNSSSPHLHKSAGFATSALQPMLHQPHIFPLSGYSYQPYSNGYMNPMQVYVPPIQPQHGYYAAANNMYPVIGSAVLIKPQFLYHDPRYQLGRRHPGMESQSLNSMVPLASFIVRQIEYYFSDENLPHDLYLNSLMDDQGWVPISKIAKFRKVERMCTHIPFILDSLLAGSSIIEVQGDKIRRQRQ